MSNEKRERRRIRQDKYSLTADLMVERLGEDTSSIEGLHVNSYRTITRSYCEILQNLKVILRFAFISGHTPYTSAVAPFLSPSFSCTCPFYTYISVPDGITHSPPIKTFCMPRSHIFQIPS